MKQFYQAHRIGDYFESVFLQGVFLRIPNVIVYNYHVYLAG